MPKCSFIAICGAPNAGKSTLFNTLLGTKISIVSPKVQTTRTTIKGILTEGETQLIFLDAPGIFKPKKRLEQAIVQSAWQSIKSVDQICLIVDLKKGITEEIIDIIDDFKQKKRKAILILNKIDAVGDKTKLELAEKLFAEGIFTEVFMTSAINNVGVDRLKTYLISIAKESPWYYDKDDVTDISQKFFASEITREKLFLYLQQELPYSLTVETEQFEYMQDGSVTIHQSIIVLKEGQKKIIIGTNGSNIKKIGLSARRELEYLLDKKIHLYLFVKVRGNWLSNSSQYEYMGLKMPS